MLDARRSSIATLYDVTHALGGAPAQQRQYCAPSPLVSDSPRHLRHSDDDDNGPHSASFGDIEMYSTVRRALRMLQSLASYRV